MDDLLDSIRRLAPEIGFWGVVRVDHQSGNLLSEAFGLAQRGLGTPNREDTQFAVASGGKGFTALAVARLIADDALALTTTARSVLGADLPLIADDVTVEHLLAHRSGIGDYLDEEDEDLQSTGYVLKAPDHELVTTEAFIPELENYPTKFPADEKFSYCNSGYIVLALIAERVSGVGYHELVERSVIEPAGLTATGFLRSDEPKDRTALGYLHADGLRTNVHHLPVKGNGDGGIYTTAPDMHMFWSALFGGRIVPDQWVAEMVRPHSDVPEKSSRYGLGFWLGPDKDPSVILVGSDAGVSFYSTCDRGFGGTPGETRPCRLRQTPF